MANPETIRKALQAILTSTARKPVPTKGAKGEGPSPFDGGTAETFTKFPEEMPIEEVLGLSPTLTTKQKQRLQSKIEGEPVKGEQMELLRSRPGEKKKTVDIIDDRAALRAATTEQGSRGSPLAPAYNKGGLSADNNNLGQQVIDEIDLSQAHRNRNKAFSDNPNKGPQQFRDKEQLDTLGYTREEMDILDEAQRVLHGADKAQNVNQLNLEAAKAAGKNNLSDVPQINIKGKIRASAKKFGQDKDLNSDIQDMYSRLDEMFPGFKKGTPNSDEFFELDPKTGKPIPGKKLQGGKDASMASKLNDTKKQMANLSQRARMIRNVDNPSKSDLELLTNIQRQLDNIEEQYFGTRSTQAERQMGDTINPESNVESISSIDDLGEDFTDFIAPNRTDAGVEFSRTYPELSQQRIAKAQQGPLSGNKPLIKEVRPNINFVPNTRGAPPVEGTLSTQDTLLNILRDIQQGNLGPIGQ